jgi:putative MATE family efflux protein
VILSILGVAFSSAMLQLMQTPEAVLSLSSLYMKIFFSGMTFNLLYNFAAAILRAAGDTKGPLIYLSISGVANAVLNVFFVTVFHMNVDGVALATIISHALSAVLTVGALIRRTDNCRLELKKMRFYKSPLLKILRIGLPAGIQSGLFSLANVIIQSSINSFNNTALMSGFGAAGNIEGFLYVSMNAFSQTSTTYVGQNFGAQKFKRVKQATLTCLACVFAVGLSLGLLIYAFGQPLLSIYIADSPEAIRYGISRMACLCIPYFLCGMMDVTTGSIRGMGVSLVPMIITIVGACGLRILWVYTIFQIPQYHTPTGLYLAFPVTWAVTFLAQLVAFFLNYNRLCKRHPSNTLPV